MNNNIPDEIANGLVEFADVIDGLVSNNNFKFYRKSNMIKYEDFAKLDLRVATIVDANPIEGADKLILLHLNDGTENVRQIVAGIKKQFPLCEESKNKLIGKQIIIIANLEPRKMKGIESQGMLLAASNNETLQLLTVDHYIEPGSKVG